MSDRISVKDRLPTVGVRVECFNPTYGSGSGHLDNGWHLHFCLNKEATPTHWRPLGEPPKEHLKAHKPDKITINTANLNESERKQAEELAEKSKLTITEWRGLKVRANPPLSELPMEGDIVFYLDNCEEKGYCSVKYCKEELVLKRNEMFATKEDVKAYVQAMIDAGWWKE